MKIPHFTLRQVSDALAQDTDDRVRTYDRARMLRDRGLVVSSIPRRQGAAMLFTEADAVAAAWAIVASLNGCSWGQIDAVNTALHDPFYPGGTKREFFRYLDDIRSGRAVYLRLDIIAIPWGFTSSSMGLEDEVSFAAVPMASGTTQTVFWPLTEIARPVLAFLSALDD